MIGGLCSRAFMAPFLFEGHYNTSIVETYLEKILLPTLEPEMTLIMDNASFHKSSKIKALLDEAKCQLIYLPPYSPDLNPMEKRWHKIKTAIPKIMRGTKAPLEAAMETTLKDMYKC